MTYQRDQTLIAAAMLALRKTWQTLDLAGSPSAEYALAAGRVTRAAYHGIGVIIQYMPGPGATLTISIPDHLCGPAEPPKLWQQPPERLPNVLEMPR